jgi:hypothetical protein
LPMKPSEKTLSEQRKKGVAHRMRMILHTILLCVLILLFIGGFILEISWMVKSRKSAGSAKEASTIAEFDFGPPLAFGSPLAASSGAAALSAWFLNPDVAIRDLILALLLLVWVGRNFRMAELRHGRSGELSLTLVAVLAFIAVAPA